MSRRKICSRHNFKPTGRGHREKCEGCGTIFPCDVSNGECGHDDCEEVRGYLPKCAVCEKNILPEDRFGLAPPGRHADLGFLPVHRFCVDSAETSLVVEKPLAAEPSVPKEPKQKIERFEAKEGIGVRLSEGLDSVYRTQFGELVDELVVEKVVDASRVIVRWIGIVPVSHLRAK